MQNDTFLDLLMEIQAIHTLPTKNGFFNISSETFVYVSLGVVVAIFKKNKEPLFLTESFERRMPVLLQEWKTSSILPEEKFDVMANSLNVDLSNTGYIGSVFVRDGRIVSLLGNLGRVYRSQDDADFVSVFGK